MAQRTKQHWITLTGGTVTAGTQLLGTHSALAHSGPHGDEAEQSAVPATDEHHTPSSESAALQESSPPVKADPDVILMPTSEIKGNSVDETPIQEIPAKASPSTAASKASLSNGLSIGLGESLLGLVIAGPFLLASLKKQLQS